MIEHRIKTFFQFLWASKNQHAVHSPFVYNFVTKCLYTKMPKHLSKKLKHFRKAILKSEKFIQMTDRGEGSKCFETSSRQVCDIAKKAGMTCHQAKLMNKIINYLNIENSLELGTSVGIGSLAMATNQSHNQIDTVEACANTSKFAKNFFKNQKLHNIKVYNTDFQTFLAGLSSDKTYDLIYLDGHHQKDATLQYFYQLKKCIHENSLFILDDIYWSQGMQEAWQTILEDEDVKVGIDLYFWGIIFFKPALSKQNFKIRCLF